MPSDSNPVLTEEELAFIGEMEFESKNLSTQSRDLTLDLAGDNRATILLERLDLASTLKLSAQYRNHKLVFPVELKQSEFGAFQMQLRTPEIFEVGSHIRNWRHHFENPLTAICRTANTSYYLHEISSTGFSLSVNSGEAPAELELDLILPDCKSELTIKAHLVRETDDAAAYSMEINSDLRERLRRFLFNRHRDAFQNTSVQTLT